MLLTSAVHASSTNEYGTPQIDCLALFANSPFSTFIWSPIKLFPSAVHVSSTFESGAPRMSYPSVVRQFSIVHFFRSPMNVIA